MTFYPTDTYIALLESEIDDRIAELEGLHVEPQTADVKRRIAVLNADIRKRLALKKSIDRTTEEITENR